MEEKIMRENIKNLLSSQQLAVLSTQRNGQPYSSLMAFSFTDDLREIIVATGKATRKHQNIVKDSRVSLLVDNRSNTEDDFHMAAGLTILGTAHQVDEKERIVYEQIYLNRHPYLRKFIASPTTGLFRINVHHYLMVSRFQNVIEYRIQDGTDLFT